MIKLGAFGDFIMAAGAFQAVRQFHRDDHVTLLTIASLAAMATRSGWFDDVWIDPRGRFPLADLAMRRRLRAGQFDRIYDFQTVARTDRYFYLLGPGRRPEWSGSAIGCSHRDPTPDRHSIHPLERYQPQLAIAGLPGMAQPDLSWLDGDVAGFGLPRRFLLMATGCTPRRLDKRWAPAHFTALAQRMMARGVTPVLLGTHLESALNAGIAGACPGCRDLTGRTDPFQLGGLARAAVAAVGNDTGPMHLITAVGCPSVVLYSFASDPALSGQRGPAVTYLRRPSLDQLSVDEVDAALQPLVTVAEDKDEA